jgi:hypothetical protein
VDFLVRLQQWTGPIPFVYGFGMIISLNLAQHVVNSTAVRRFIEQSDAEPLREKSRYASACDPTGDGTLGWVLTHLDPPPMGVTLVDVVYANRIQLWPSAASEEGLRQRTAVMHRATDWEQHFRAALCTSAEPVVHDGGLARPRNRFRYDRAPVLRCRGRDAPTLRCGAMGCGGSADIVYPSSQCAQEPGCVEY